MRLMEFSGDDIPPYAILSHTWDKEEVAYKDYGTSAALSMAGWGKIKQTCNLAVCDNLGYVWIDTCCIDKSSSAELSEAINSMFQWYARSRVCYAFLEDCDKEFNWCSDTFPLASSRWLSRGWTLQELIAPQVVIFYDRHWQRLSTRRDLSEKLNLMTGIPREILDRDHAYIGDLLQLVPVCQKMHWASGRKTTRVEDMAYCLMGIFGINMPLLYGEGSKAFTRLQEEIIRHSNDLTIFAWRTNGPEFVEATHPADGLTGTSQNSDTEAIRGLLAASPHEFCGARSIEPGASTYNQEYTVTNKGIRISSINVRPKSDSSDLLMDLYCFDKQEGASNQMIRVVIRHIGGGLFVRMESDLLYFKFSPGWEKEVFTADLYLAMSVTKTTMALLETVRHDAIRIPKTAGSSFHRQHVAPRLQLQSDSGLFITHGFPNAVGCATYYYKIPGREQQVYRNCNLVVFFWPLRKYPGSAPLVFYQYARLLSKLETRLVGS